MLVVLNNAFYINAISPNNFTSNKTIDIKYASCDVSYLESKIILNFVFYVANNLNLPSDALRLNLELPSQQISNILMIPSKDAINIDNPKVDKGLCQIYKSRVIIDTLGDEYFASIIATKDILMNCYFSLDSSSLESNQVEVDKNIFATFIDEIHSLKISFVLKYENFFIVNIGIHSIKHVNSLVIDSDFNTHLNFDEIQFYLPEFESTNVPLVNLFSIKTNSSAKIFLDNFYISIDYFDKGIKKNLAFKMKDNYQFFENFNFHMNYELFYDYSLNEYKYRFGKNGINFNEDNLISYQLYFDLTINGSKKKYQLNKNFIWSSKAINQINITSEQKELTNYETIFE